MSQLLKGGIGSSGSKDERILGYESSRKERGRAKEANRGAKESSEEQSRLQGRGGGVELRKGTKQGKVKGSKLR
jgi:hypothetical protein